MSKKKNDNNGEDEQPKLAWLIEPAKDLVANFDIDLLHALSEYLNVIRKAGDENALEMDAAGNYKLFDFQEAVRVINNSMNVYAKKVDHIYELTLSVVDLFDRNGNDGEPAAARRGPRGRKNVNLGSTSYELIDVKLLMAEAFEGWEKSEKEEKKAIDNLRLVKNAEDTEMHYDRNCCLIAKPTQFMFKLNYGQLNRTDEQVQNAKSRPEVIGKVKDFDIKKSEMNHEQQMLFTHDCYRSNVDQFTLPGARWVPDNKDLAKNFGVADIEVELDLENEHEKINAYGPFKDPLSGREVVAPPKWFIEQEAVRQKQDIQSRANSRATSLATRTLRDSQQFGSQPTRLSQPFVERHRNNLNQFVSFVEGRLNKNRPSAHLNTGLVDMFVDNFGAQTQPFNHNNGYDPMEVDDEYDGEANNDDYDAPDDYVNDLTKRKERKAPAPWDDFENGGRMMWYTGDEDIQISRKSVKTMTKDPPSAVEMMKRKHRKEAKIGKTRRDEFMETHEYLQDYYYWRSAARINPNKDWKVEALRTAILKEKKRRAKDKIARIREARAQMIPKRRTARPALAMEDFDFQPEDVETAPTNRKTLGAEYEDVADEDLAAEVEFSMLGGEFEDDEDDVQPRGEFPPVPASDNYEFNAADTFPPPAQATHQPLRFDDIDDAELNTVINLPGNLLIDKALPLLKKFAENRTDREQMAYEMAKAYEDVDVAVSTLQEQVDNWHAKLDPILEEGETRKEYNVHHLGNTILAYFETEGDTKRLVDLVVGRPWYEISRCFLSCLFMCNSLNVMVADDKELSLEERINSMKISLLNREMHHEVFAQDDAFA
ncbi:unnamed protein product [Caenorhabditis sp. 36 PRJEB53466]|nr:unnamed protein product [Caenorhabditis sp. 36 PRJEB53466]